MTRAPSSPAAQRLLAWEYQALTAAVSDVFGYHALQLGMAHLPVLQANRMPHRWLALRQTPPASNTPPPAGALHTAPAVLAPAQPHLFVDFAALPFPDACLDLVVLPHTLETDAHPHGVLREVARVLVPGGRLVVCGLNPTSLWPWQTVGEGPADNKIGYWRLRDWLGLLDFEVVQGEFGGFRPPVQSSPWLQRWRWLDSLGPRWFPMLGAAYVLTAVKQVRGMRLMAQAWRPARAARAQTAPVAGSTLGTP